MGNLLENKENRLMPKTLATPSRRGVAISVGATERFAPHFTCALRVGVGYS